jgi:hypothetical protein
MKYQNIVVYFIIALALLSIPSLLENVQAQTTSANQTVPQQTQNINLTAQALMKINIFEVKDTLMKAKLAIIDGHHLEALTDVRNVETQLLLVKPAPTKFLSDMHKAIYAIARSDIDKSLDIITKIQLEILKAENQIFKAAVENPQVMQQVKAAVANPPVMQQFDTAEPNTNEEEDSTGTEEEDSTGTEEEDSTGTEEEEDSTRMMQQFNNVEPYTNEEEYFTGTDEYSIGTEEDSTDIDDT